MSSPLAVAVHLVAALCNPDLPVTPIHDVQGAGYASPIVSSTVIIEGIVVGDFQDGGMGVHGDLLGFYVQEQDAETDGNPATSEGIFIFDGASPAVDVDPGDQVCITGTVTEYFGETEINATVTGGEVSVVSSGNPLPSARVVSLPRPGTIVNDDGKTIGDYEQYEGERIRVGHRLTATNTANLDQYGEMTLSEGGRLEAFTQTNPPSAVGFGTWVADNARRSLRLDDGFRVEWPDPIPYPPPGLSLTNFVRLGQRVGGLVGVMSYRRGAGANGDQDYRLMPTQPPTFRMRPRRPTAPPRVRGDVTVASFNVEYFLNGSSGNPASFPLGSGQTTFSEYLRQRAKLIATLVELNADIVGLVELENDYLDGAGSAIQDLVDGVNAILGPGTYEYLDPADAFGTSPLIVGLIYKPAAVTPVGSLIWLYTDDFANPNANIFKLNRPALTQTFDSPIGGFTVSVNHFKAKGCGPPPTGLDIDQGDGQACYNDTRTKGGYELMEWLANDPTSTTGSLGSYDPDILIIGDLNSHPMEDPIAAIKAGLDGVSGNSDDFVDLLTTGDHSFVFQGEAGRLDYALASPSLAAQVSRARVWHLNADEADAFGYAEDNPAPAALYAADPFRSSDHDAVIVGLDGGSSPIARREGNFRGRHRPLSDPHPNPFNPTTTFDLTVDVEQHVQVSAFDVLGRRVAILFDGFVDADASERIFFDAADLPTGTYLIRAQGELFNSVIRAQLLK